MKKLLIFCGFILSCGYVSAQNYGATYTPISRPTNSNYSQSTTNYYIENQESETEWEEHEITGIYTQAQSLEDIKRSDCIKINDDYYIPARVKNGTYDIEIGDKVDSKFYNIRNTQLYFNVDNLLAYLHSCCKNNSHGPSHIRIGMIENSRN